MREDLKNKIELAIKLLEVYEPLALSRSEDGYIVGYSGGKDSEVLVDIFKKSGVKFLVIHNFTTIDAPETVRFVRERMKDFGGRIFYPKKSFYQSLKDKDGFLPSHKYRWCCKEFKECKREEYANAVYSFGVRKAESPKRKARRGAVEYRNNRSKKAERFHFDNDSESKIFEPCYTNKYICVNPIVDWTDKDVWDYIYENNLPINPLYLRGYKRIGCIGCPLSVEVRKQFEEYPARKKAIIHILKQCNIDPSLDGAEDKFECWLTKLSVKDYVEMKKHKQTKIEFFEDGNKANLVMSDDK